MSISSNTLDRMEMKESIEKEERHAILMIAFFNVDLIEQTLKSLLYSLSPPISPQTLPYDIYILENPSPNSSKILEMLKKYKHLIKKHILSDLNNFANIIVDAFDQNLIPTDYQYYSVTESDVYLDPGAYDEAISIMEKYQFKVCAIDLLLDNLPVKKYPMAHSWVPLPRYFKDYTVGLTGFQFIVFDGLFFLEYLASFQQKKDQARSTGQPCDLIRDQLLDQYCKQKGIVMARTKNKKLLHLGWNLYAEDDNEYVKLKAEVAQMKPLWSWTPGAKLTVIPEN